MDRHNLITSLQLLDKEELKKLEKFLRSPYFVTNDKLLLLFLELKPKYPNFELNAKVKEKIFFKIYQDKKKYVDGTMRQTITRLDAAVKKFLVIQELSKKEETAQQLLLDAYNSRGTYEKLRVESENFLDTFQEKDVKNTEDYLHEYKVAHRLINNPGHDRFSDSKKELLYRLDYYYALRKLSYFCDALNRSKINGKFEFDENTDWIRVLCYKLKLAEEPAIKGYLILLDLLEKKIDFEKAYNDYLAVHERLPRSISKELSLQLINEAIRKIRAGESKYREYSWELYKIGLENDSFSENDQISTGNYLNIVITGVAIEEFDWTHNFIQSYKQYIELDQRESTYSMAMAYWLFHKAVKKPNSKDFLECLEQLNLLGKRHKVPLNLRLYSLRTRCLYELFRLDDKYDDRLEKGINNFRGFLNREENFEKAQGQPYLEALSFMEKLVKFYFDKSILSDPEREKQKLIDDLESDELQIANKHWFLEKARAL